jgi:cytosine deaminase
MFAHMSSTIPKPATLLRRARIVHDGRAAESTSDVLLVDGTISAIGALSPQAGDDVVDLDGFLLFPAAVEPHAHLDKAFLAERIVNPTGDLLGAIEAMTASRNLTTVDDIAERAERAARLMAANGYCAVRTHVDVTVENGLRSVEALTRVRERLPDVIDIEIVALTGWPVTGALGADHRALLRDAIAGGADRVGGCPHLEEAHLADGRTREATAVLLEIADDLDVAVDLHTDETLDPRVDSLSDLAHAVLDGFDLPVSASHCVSLGQRSDSDQRATAELVASAGIDVIALPHTNLFLQGRGHAPMPRGLTAVAALRAAGVNVAAGADNLQDPFNPLGRACPFETAGLMIMTAHLLPDEAWNAVSTASSIALRRPAAQVTVGGRADLVAVRARTVREAIAFAPTPRLVWRSGHPIGETESSHSRERGVRGHHVG